MFCHRIRIAGAATADATELRKGAPAGEYELNPATRTLRMVNLEDAEQADFVFDELMGNEVEGRKKWIMANAKAAELDL